MPKRIVFINKSIIIFEIVLPAIIRRVDVDNVNFASVGIGQFRERGEIVALNNEVIGSVGIIGYNRVDFIVVALDEDGEVFAKAFLDVLGLFFPYKPVLFMSSYKFKQRGFFFVVQTIKGLYLSSKFCFVHGTSGCFEAA